MTTLRCPSCGAEASPEEQLFECVCGDLFDVEHELAAGLSRDLFEVRSSPRVPQDSGVWRFRELVDPSLPREAVIHLGEGDTPLYDSPALSDYTGVEHLWIKHEGMNPTGSFKDRGMTVAISRAIASGAGHVLCASTGNTAASMAAYAARAGVRATVLVPEGATALGKLMQSLAYGAQVVQVRGDFDCAMALVRAATRDGRLALLNSANPFRIEGQKSIVLELLAQLGWEVPEWLVFPAGNLGNCAAFGKALREARQVGLVDRVPRLAAVQAEGAAPFARAFERGFDELRGVRAETVATAIRIGEPVSYARAVRSLGETRGVALAVEDAAILDAKAAVDRAGLGAEPASCAAIAGARELRRRGSIAGGERVACVLTGHLLKDPDTTLRYHQGAIEGVESRAANVPVTIDPEPDALARLLE